MSVQLVLKNSSVQDKEATAAQLAVGELALNYHSSGPFLQCEDSAGNIWRLGGVVIASTAPSSPSKGAWWLDSDDDSLHFYDGSSWVEISTQEIAPGKIAEGSARQLLQTNAAGTDTEWTSNIDVPGTLDVTGVATFDNNVVISGNLTVDGTTTTIDSTTLVVEDKNVELGAVDTPTDTTANGGGITLKGATDKTLTWVSSTGAWTFNQPLDVNGEVECDGIANGTSSVSVANNGNVTITRAGTTSIDVDGNGVQLPDNIKLRLGSSSDLQIYHDGSNSIIDDIGTGNLMVKGANVQLNSDVVSIKNNANNEDLAKFNANGAVQLFHDNSEKLNTTSSGINVTGEVQGDSLDIDGSADIAGTLTVNQLIVDDDGSGSPTLRVSGDDGSPWGLVVNNNTYTTSDILGFRVVQTDDGTFYTDYQGDGSYENVYIRSGNGTTSQNVISIDSNRAVNLHHANSTKLTTTSSGINVTGSVTNDGIQCDGVANLDGSYVSFNENGYIRGDVSGVLQLQAGTSQLFRFVNNGNSTTFAEITSGGFNPGANNTYDLGTSSLQWRDAYFDGTVNCDGISNLGSASFRNDGSGIQTVGDFYNATSGGHAKLTIRTYANGSGDPYIWFDAGGSNMVVGNYYQGGTNNLLRLGAGDSVSSVSGIEINGSGHCAPTANNSYDLGSSSKRWRDIYTQDIDVNGTTTVQGKVVGIERTATASSFDLNNGNMWTFGAIAVPNPTNQSAGMMGSLRVTAAPTSFAANWKFPGGSYTAPTSFPAVAPFFVQASGTILVGSWTEGIA